jgi:hypothetical protein|tara:strand:- start:6266 stop:6424 length:159 start_codon:yes stop_codon:yes gene_type:complete
MLQNTPFADTDRISVRIDDLVAIAEGPTPDPIPNSAVKPSRANGTLAQATGE